MTMHILSEAPGTPFELSLEAPGMHGRGHVPNDGHAGHTLTGVALIVGFSGKSLSIEPPPFWRLTATSAEDARRLLGRNDITALVLGPEIAYDDVRDLVRLLRLGERRAKSTGVLLVGSHDARVIDECLEAGHLSYAAPETIDDADLDALIVAAIRRSSQMYECNQLERLDPSSSSGRLTFCERLALQTDELAVFRLLAEEVRVQLGADRVRVCLYDSQEHALHSTGDASHEECPLSAAHGLAGFVVQTGQTLSLSRVGTDPRYDADVDDPLGEDDARFIASPVPSLYGPAVGVVTAARHPGGQPFSSTDRELLSWLIACAAAALSTMRLRNQAVREASVLRHAQTLYREEALEQHRGGTAHQGALFVAEPAWLRHTHWLPVMLVVIAVAFAIFAKMDDLAVGPVVVRARHKTMLSAPVARTIRSIDAPVASHVHRGDILIRFYDLPGDTALERVNADIRAPLDGIVSYVRVQAGDHVSSGESLISLVDERAGFDVVALLPGSYAPQLHRGMPLLIRLDGYEDIPERTFIEEVDLEVVPATDAARTAGIDATGGLGLTGKTILVRSALASSTYQADGRRYLYHDGMTGKAEVAIRTEPILFKLCPPVKRLLHWS